MVIAGTHSGSGKTTLAIGLMAALTRRGHVVQPFKVGPDFIDPAFHSAVTGRPSRNLDPWLLSEDGLKALFTRHAPRRGISIIEGVMGLYDGQGNGAFASTAHVAALVEAPVLLVINAEGVSLSAAALVSGFAGFSPRAAGPDLAGLRIGGILLNRVSGVRQYTALRAIIEGETNIPCFGFLPRSMPSLPHRHLGLVPAAEQTALPCHVDHLVRAVEDFVDLNGLANMAASAPALQSAVEPPATAATPGPGPRIGVAVDAAFSFYYPDNLEYLEELGARLVPFSPLADKDLPENMDGLYLGGGFPEQFAEKLEANETLRNAIRLALDRGLPAYAECGGMLYLCASLTPETGPARSMVGFFPARAVMSAALQPFGYVTARLERDCIMGPAGSRFNAHEFHYSQLVDTPEPALVNSQKADGRIWYGGMQKAATVAWYPHLHFRGSPGAAQSFVNACRAFCKQRHTNS